MKFTKFIAALSAAAMMAAVSAVTVSANLPSMPSADDNCYLEYQMTDNGAVIAGAYDDQGEPAGVEAIAIPEKTDKGIPVVGIGAFAFADCNNLKEVTVPDSIEIIDDAAFLKTEDVDTFIESQGIDTTKITPDGLAYIANQASFMGKNDWKGDEEELEAAHEVFVNVLNTVTNSDANATHGKAIKNLYNLSDISTVVRTGEEDTLEKMSMKTYEAFLAWVKTVPYVDFTVKASEDSYAAKFAQGKAVLGMKYEPSEKHLLGDATQDGVVNVRDCAKIANAVAFKTTDKLCTKCADFNEDGVVNVRDAANLANALATGKIKAAA